MKAGPVLEASDRPMAHLVPGLLVNDDGRYSKALDSGVLERRPMFTELDGSAVVWPDGTREPVDAAGMPLHTGGVSVTHPGLAHLGLEFQRSFASSTLRGVGADAANVMAPLAAYAHGAATAVGL